jgi:superfamily II DNA helicase RecQ
MVQVKLFALRFCDDLDGFDDEPLRSFLGDKEVVSLKEQFFFKDNVPYWSIMVMYKSRSRHRDVSKESQKKGEDTRDDYRSLLTEQSTPLFNLLREWRNEKSKKAGFPPYIMFTNRQLAEIAGKYPETLTHLGSVEGVGRAKIKKYGEDILQIVKALKEQQKLEKPAETKEASTQAKNSAQKQPEPSKAPEKDQGTLWSSARKEGK